MAFDDYFARLGVVLGRIGIDIAVAGVDRYIPVSRSQPILVIRVAGRGDFDRLLLRGQFRLRQDGCAKEAKNRLKHLTHGRCRSYRRRRQLQRQKQCGRGEVVVGSRSTTLLLGASKPQTGHLLI